ncbi:MAG: hypothetical protein R3E39_24970 [Anaerolineae bacterium]
MNTNIIKRASNAIILVAFSDAMSKQEIVEAYMDSVETACKATESVSIYRVFDLREAGKSASIIAGVIAEMTQGLVGAPVVPKTNSVIVAQQSFMNPTSMSFFTSFDAVLAHIGSQPLRPAA